MELDAFDRQVAVAHCHDLAVVGGGRDVQHRGQARTLDRERMVACAVEWRRHVREDAALVVDDRLQLAVHHALRTNHPATECLPDGLVAEADAENRYLAGEPPDERHGHAGLVRRTRSGRDHDVRRTERFDASLSRARSRCGSVERF